MLVSEADFLPLRLNLCVRMIFMVQRKQWFFHAWRLEGGGLVESVKLVNLPHWLPSSSDHTTVLVMNVWVMRVWVMRVWVMRVWGNEGMGNEGVG